MNDFPQQFWSSDDSLVMSDDEKSQMKAALEAHMEQYPLGILSPFSWVTIVGARVAVALVVIVALGGGTAFAAQGALPGDPLYAIKVNVNEAVQGALAVSDAAKASFNAQLAAERLKEAQQLAIEGKLTATTSSELQQNFDQHIAAASTYAQAVQQHDASAAPEVAASMTVVKAESSVLAALGERKGDGQDNAARTFAMHADAVLAASTSAETATLANDTADATTTRRQALFALHAFQQELQVASSSLDASTSAALASTIDSIQTALSAGDAASSSKERMSNYLSALSSSTALQTYLNAEQEFKGTPLLTALLSGQSAPSEDEGHSVGGSLRASVTASPAHIEAASSTEPATATPARTERDDHENEGEHEGLFNHSFMILP